MYSFNSRVRYSEVNSEKELTLPSLLDYLQDCCTFQSEDLEIGVDYLAKEQVAWVLSSWEIKIYRYPQMGQHIKVSTWPYAFRGFYGYRNFRIEGDDGIIFAEANSVFMDTEKMRPARISERMKEIYTPEINDEIPGEWADRKISLPDDAVKKSVKKEPVRVSRFYIDTNHHMNNGKYILVAEEYLPDFVRSIVSRQC
jgi:medium-chain acyl-[acyl-carrier-protein] hydrolase